MRNLLLLACAALGSFAAAPSPSFAAVPPAPTIADISNTHVLTVHSAINGVDYQIFVTLPPGYDPSRAYPGFYLMDGNTYFPLASFMQHRMEGDFPPMLFISVGYVGRSERAQDYATIAEHAPWQVAPNRGAEVFLRVLREEILPFVEGRYRVDPTRRGLGGHSLGGFFTAYTLFHATDLFSRYWISSPSLVWDNPAMFRFESEYARSHRDLPVRVFSDIGELEDQQMIDLLSSLRRVAVGRGYPNLQWQSHQEAEMPHSMVPEIAFPRALYFLFGRPSIALPEAALRRMTGRYRFSDGSAFELRLEGGALRVVGYNFGGLSFQKVTLLSETPNQFYTRYIGLSISTDDAASPHPTHLRIERTFEGRQAPPALATRVAN